MKINIIVAMSENHVIGYKNQLPWHLPADLKYFKSMTVGKTIVMGRKTFESIGHALPHRENIILSRRANFEVLDCKVVHSIEALFKRVDLSSELMVIGGAHIFELFLPYTQKIYLTLIHHEFEGDVFFPELDMTKWQEIKRVDYLADEKNRYAYSFIELSRIF